MAHWCPLSAIPCLRDRFCSATQRFSARSSATPRFNGSALPYFRASATPRLRAGLAPRLSGSPRALPRLRASTAQCFHASATPRFHGSVFPCFRDSAPPRWACSAPQRFSARSSATPRFNGSALPCFHASVLPCFRASALPCFRASVLPLEGDEQCQKCSDGGNHQHPYYHRPIDFALVAGSVIVVVVVFGFHAYQWSR